MRNLLLVAALLCGVNFAHSQQIVPCYTDEVLQKKIESNPQLKDEFRQSRLTILESINPDQRGGATRIIPVVFHIIHAGGSENISKDQILDQMRILNEDFSRTNPDTSLTRNIFKPVAGNPDIEFRLAQKDPEGNCTDGIVRVYSTQTTGADDNAKLLSSWPRNKYLNVWVVRSIDADGQGVILGYAQLPGFGDAETDGVIVRHDVVGTIGSANPSFKNAGRTLTHEVGHWLGLLHTFQGGCGGGFGEGISDTPPIAQATTGCDTTQNTCSNDNPDLPDQIENYMDYSDGVCQNMFSQGQVDVMDGVLGGFRSNLITSGNLEATGTDGTPADTCIPVANFYTTYKVTCVGDDITFHDDTYNGVPDTYSWSFAGGNPASSSDESPTVQFSQPGFHDVSLTVSNTSGSDTRTETDYIYVFPTDATVSSWIYVEDFEGSNPNSEDWVVINNEGLGSGWQQVSTAFSGSKGMKLNNHSGNPGGAIDDLILPPIDFTQFGSASLTFKVANAQRPGGTFSSPSSDNLRVYVSTNCGTSWQLRYNKSGSNLATVSSTNSAFTPNSESQWREETVNVSSYLGREHVLIRFEARSDGGNNIYLDDINLSGPTSVMDNDDIVKLSLVPNPAHNQVRLSFDIKDRTTMKGEIIDITGRNVLTVFNTTQLQGPQTFDINTQNLAKGMYYVRLTGLNTQYVEKLILN